MPDGRVAIRRALISVSDKSRLQALAMALHGRGVELLSTGGTAVALREARVPVTEVATVTGFPEILGGRVKTLHPAIHGGILARRDVPGDVAALETHGIPPIDLVVSNLYPFTDTVVSGTDDPACIETIDIGGPALIRAAAKNHAHVAVVTDPADYDALAAHIADRAGGTDLSFRQRLAATAFAHTAAYDAAVAEWMTGRFGAEETPSDRQPGESTNPLPPRLFLAADRRTLLRYGENPHQQAAFYTLNDFDVTRPGAATAKQVQGKALSYNNLNDADAVVELVAEFDRPAVAIVKHANPCGVAEANNLVTAWDRALACDPVSAFGGIVAVNRPLDGETAARIAGLFVEVVIAPAVTDDARPIFSAKPALRLLEMGAMPAPAAPGLMVRSIAGGLLVQTRDSGRVRATDLTVVTARQPTEPELGDLLFAFAVAKHAKSNAIVCAKDGATLGIGAGQMSRVDSARIAVRKALDAAAGAMAPTPRGAVVASDAFLPFADGLLAVAEAGVTAVIQPGGSRRDREVIDAANAHGLAMAMTGMRHFRH